MKKKTWVNINFKNISVTFLELTKFLTKYNTHNPGTMQSLVENSNVINTCLTKKGKTKEGGKAEQKPPGLLGFIPVTALETYILYNVGTST